MRKTSLYTTRETNYILIKIPNQMRGHGFLRPNKVSSLLLYIDKENT